MALPETVLVQRRRKTGLLLLLSLAILAAAVFLIRLAFRSTISRSSITTAVVTRGDIENTLNASGVVSPEFEEILTSPIIASVQKVLVDVGNPIQPGQSVLTLDKAASQTEYEKLEIQLETGRNNIRKLRLELDKSFFDLKSNNDIKQLRINSLEAAVENAKRLYKAGGGTREDIEQAELNLKVARLEKQQLENEITSKQQTMQVEIKASELAAKVQESDLAGLAHKLQQANIVASRSGVVTWVNKNIGAMVKEGESLARIADLGSFKITGSISDNFIDSLKKGQDVIVRINETQIRGRIVNIYPSVQNGIVSFDVSLPEKQSSALRPDMKVDVFPITAMRRNILRVPNGPAFKGSAVQDIFVVKDGKAIRRTVHTGLSNFDYIELTDAVEAGETIITSDMSEYKTSREIIIQ